MTEPNSDPRSRNQLATDIRSYALRLFWFNQKGGAEQEALQEAQQLVRAVATYGEMLAAEIAEPQEAAPLDDSDRPDDS
jgi:hypothetical protein